MASGCCRCVSARRDAVLGPAPCKPAQGASISRRQRDGWMGACANLCTRGCAKHCTGVRPSHCTRVCAKHFTGVRANHFTRASANHCKRVCANHCTRTCANCCTRVSANHCIGVRATHCTRACAKHCMRICANLCTRVCANHCTRVCANHSTRACAKHCTRSVQTIARGSVQTVTPGLMPGAAGGSAPHWVPPARARPGRGLGGGPGSRTRGLSNSALAAPPLGTFRSALGRFRRGAGALGSFRPRSAPAAPPRPAPRESGEAGRGHGRIRLALARGWSRPSRAREAGEGRTRAPALVVGTPPAPRAENPSHWSDTLGPTPASLPIGSNRRKAG